MHFTYYKQQLEYSNTPLTLILCASNTGYAILSYGNVGRSQIAVLIGQNVMKQEQTQRGTQPNNTAQKEQYPVQEGEASAARPDARPRRVQRCANCDIEFFWPPTVVQNNVYCCTGCAAGGPCTCDYSLYRSVIIMGVIHYEP